MTESAQPHISTGPFLYVRISSRLIQCALFSCFLGQTLPHTVDIVELPLQSSDWLFDVNEREWSLSSLVPISFLHHAQEVADKQKEKERKKTLQGLQKDAQKRSKQFEKKVSCVFHADEAPPLTTDVCMYVCV